MNKNILKNRTKRFAIDIFLFVNTIPKSQATTVLTNQLLRSASSVGANYRATDRSKSKADFIYKLNIVQEETDESMFWLEMLLELDKGNKIKIKELWSEANEIISIITASLKTLKSQK